MTMAPITMLVGADEDQNTVGRRLTMIDKQVLITRLGIDDDIGEFYNVPLRGRRGLHDSTSSLSAY